MASLLINSMDVDCKIEMETTHEDAQDRDPRCPDSLPGQTSTLIVALVIGFTAGDDCLAAQKKKKKPVEDLTYSTQSNSRNTRERSRNYRSRSSGSPSQRGSGSPPIDDALSSSPSSYGSSSSSSSAAGAQTSNSVQAGTAARGSSSLAPSPPGSSAGAAASAHSCSMGHDTNSYEDDEACPPQEWAATHGALDSVDKFLRGLREEDCINSSNPVIFGDDQRSDVT